MTMSDSQSVTLLECVGIKQFQAEGLPAMWTMACKYGLVSMDVCLEVRNGGLFCVYLGLLIINERSLIIKQGYPGFIIQFYYYYLLLLIKF